MIKVSICEENIVTRRLLIEMLGKLQMMHNIINAELPQGENFITSAASENPDIILLSENFNCGLTSKGFETAKTLRTQGCTAVIIMMTVSPENIYNSPELKPLSCILKPFKYDDICRLFLESIDTNLLAGSIDIKHRHAYKNIDVDDIIYIEADKRYTNIRTCENNYLCNESISSLEERLPKRFFFRTHRTYILNFKHISGINDCLIEMDNGEFVILSRHKKIEFDKAYSAYKKSENKCSAPMRIGA
ncbi:MAG: response regulator transcription factor [Oscillospiraceae bacterium]|nr:response regulator transcription factor [Oscillospiraceae bacterium]MBQ9982541.1 response regulator transcription factor [Oscillospiraceae bacterium]